MVINKQGVTPTRFNQLTGYNNYYNPTMVEDRSYIFECHLTVDERYFILHDEVFDIQEQTKLGNLWDSVDIFKTIFKNVQLENIEYKQIQEGWRTLPILESGDNLHALRNFLLEWSFFDDTWAGRKMKDAGQGIADFASTSWEGIKKMGIAVSKGDWSEILNLLEKGILYVLRKLKGALYSTIGIIVDAILVATGIGKGVQIAAWGLITALDVYQLSTNNYTSEEKNNPMWYKIMELGFDILGLVTAGVAAKGARAVFSPLKGLKVTSLAQKVAKSPRMKSIIQNVYNSSKSGSSYLKRVQKQIASKWPAGASFINKILGSLERFIKKIQTYCGQILKQSNLKGVAKRKPIRGKGYVVPVKSSGEFAKKATMSGGLAAGVSYGIDKFTGNDENIGKYFKTDGGPLMGVELDQDALDL